MYCSNCGQRLDDDAKFCKYCGAKVSVTDEKKAAAVSDLQQAAQQIPSSAGQGAFPQQSGAFNAAGTQNYAGMPQGYVPQQNYTPQHYDTQVQKPKKKKFGLAIIAAILLIALIGGGAFYFIKIRPDKLYDKYVSQSDEYVRQGDYNSAIDEMKKAYELRPDDAATRRKLMTIYCNEILELIDNKDYAGAIDVAKQLRDSGLDTKEFTSYSAEEYLTSCYAFWLSDLDDQGDIEGIKEVLADAKISLNEEQYNELESAISYVFSDGPETAPEPEPQPEPEPPADDDTVTLVKDIKSYAERIADFSDIAYDDGPSWDNMPTLCMEMSQYNDMVLDAIGSESSVTVKVTGYRYDNVVFTKQDDTYYIYYGDLDSSGVRNGSGWIITTYDYSGEGDLGLYFYFSDWTDGVANGFFAEYNIYGPGYINVWSKYGNVKDWMYDGRITIKWTDGKYYFSTFNNGIVEVIDIGEDGRPIIAINETEDYWLYGIEERLNDPDGLEIMP